MNSSSATKNGLAPGTVEFSRSADGSSYAVVATQTGFSQGGIAQIGTNSNEPAIGSSNYPVPTASLLVRRTDGTPLFNPDFTTTAGTTTGTFSDAAGNAWNY